MSAITWTTETPAAPLISFAALKITAKRLGFGLALIAASGAAYAGILLAVLMSTSIIQI